MASKTIGKVSKEIGGLGKMGRTASRGLMTLGANVAKMGMVAAAGLGAFVVAGVKMAGDFEAQMNTINTVAMLSVDRLGAVGDGIRKLARDTGTPLEELTAAFYDLVSAGVSVKDSQGVLNAANQLAIGGLGTTAETVDLLTTALNSYGLKASQVGPIADMFAQAIGAGKVTAAELAQSFAQVGSVAASSGIEINELAAGYAQLTAKGIPAGTASTQMRAAIVALIKPNTKLNALQKETGLNFAKIAKEKGLVVALERIRTEATKAKMPFAKMFESVEAYNAALATTGSNLEGYKKNLDAVNKSEGVAEKQAAERKKGLDFQLSRIKALARDAAITIGSKLLPKITPVIEKLAAFIDAHQAEIERFGDALARGFEGAALWAQKLPWDSIVGGLKAAATFGKGLVEVFARMPPEAMGAILALGGLNKLTGGAIGSIVGQLGAGLVKGVLGMTAGVVNAKAGVVNVIGGAGAGGGLLPGGGKGGFTGFMKNLGALTILGGSLALLVEQFGKFQEEGRVGAETLRTQADVGVPQLTLQAARDALRNTQEQLSNPINDLALMLSGTRDEVKRTEKLLQDRIAFLEAGGQPSGGKPSGVTGGRGDVGTAGRVAAQSARAGIWERALAKTGKAPTERALAGTAHLNQERNIWQRAVTAGMGPPAKTITAGLDKSRQATAAAAAAAARTEAATRAASMLAQFAAVRAIAAQVMGTAAIVTAIHGIAAPRVSVNLTVRDQLVAQKKYLSYGKGP